ncbi:PREDICTED: uncharacterized protein LOC105625440 [Atta cephalotes]|uniref:Uncharacterized protein n=1 Tax=Atta cephalotes TaxID=12957 RepID=A0A158NXA0_ATTCE|nr:PREDICTED: uncharacterized protein LOC105625440 [Atta cephalotes]
MVLVLLIPVIGFVAANPFSNTLNNRLVPQVQKALSLSTENRLDIIDDSPDKINEMVENTNETTLSILKHINHHFKESKTRENETNEKRTQGRKHKALFVDYPLLSRIIHYPRMPAYENDNSELTAKDRSASESDKRYPESDIFYIRLPPIPYMFVPGIGYISQPPTYSSAPLKPPISFVPQLVQLHHVRPVRPQPASQQTVNSFIKLPIDFISNGKPTAVYQWQKKPGKKPTDSPITNLDNLSADFVNNGKPTSIYQWQANLRPVKRPDNSLNSLDMGPYTFNGKLTSVYLLESNDSTTMHQSIRHSNYQNVR